MNNTIKALLGAALLTTLMTGCETMAERADRTNNGEACSTTDIAAGQLNAKKDCDKAGKKDCDKKAKKDCDKAGKKDCDKKAKAGCDKSGKAAKATKAACPTEKKAMDCGDNCTMPCCA